MNGDEFTVLTDDRSSDGYPAITVDKDNHVWVVWQSYREGRDSILARFFDGHSWSEEIPVSMPCGAFGPQVTMDGTGKIGIVWSALENGSGNVFARFYEGKSWSSIVQVTDSNDACNAAICGNAKGGFWVAWNTLGRRSDVWVRCYDGKVWKQATRITNLGTAYRPAVAVDGQGRLWVLFDAFRNGKYDVFAMYYDGTAWSGEVKISSSPDWCATAKVCSDAGDGFWALWDEIGKQAHVSYGLRCFDGESWLQPLSIGPTRSWCAYSSVGVAPCGKPFVSYNWRRGIHVRSVEDGRLTDPVPIYRFTSTKDRYCRRPSTAIDNSGRLWIAWQSSFGNRCHPRNADVWVQCIPIDQFSQLQDLKVEKTPYVFLEKPYRRKSVEGRGAYEDDFIQDQGMGTGYEGYRLFWGDIHGHATLSDGLGEIDQYYRALRHTAKLDFGALSEHDAFPDVITSSEWELIRAGAATFNDPPHFVTFTAYEWTSSESTCGDLRYGHRNVYYLTKDGPILRCTDPESNSPDKLFKSLKDHRSLVFPHHPAVNGSWNAMTDWDSHDPEIQRAVEIFSIHGAFEYFGMTSPYAKNVSQIPDHSLQDALLRGYKLGVIAGSDTHQMEPGIEGGLVAAYAKDLNREALFDALYERRVYATTGARIVLLFSINGSIMGNELQGRAGEPLSIDVAVRGTARIRHIDVLKDNVEIVTQPGDSPTAQLHLTDVEEEGFRGTRWYYVRITQDDDHMAWSSPIWVTY